MTVKTRITLFIVGAGFISSLLFSVVVFYELLEQPFDILDTQLEEEAHRTIGMVVKEKKDADVGLPESASRETDRYWIEIYDKTARKTIYRSSLAKSIRLPQVNPGAKAIVRPLVSEKKTTPSHPRNQDKFFRARTFSLEMDGRTFLVRIARSMDKLNEEIWDLFYGILAGLVFSTLALIAISHVIAGKILRPIGEMKNLAQEISERNLERRIPTEAEGRDEFSELAKTINRMLDRLQYSFVRQRNFLFDTSHELKTPLTTIRLAIDELVSGDDGNLSPSIENNLLRLKNQVLRMERLVKDLLSLSSLETITGIDPRPVQISALMSSLLEEYRFLADARNIEIDVRFPDGLVIHGDEEKLRRAFSNILDNAVKYNLDGGKIELTGIPSQHGLRVIVANTGSGIPAEEIPRIFDQFHRVEKSRADEYGGSGLGLSIVKRIIELHGGSVRLESETPGWTRVIVDLPTFDNRQ